MFLSLAYHKVEEVPGSLYSVRPAQLAQHIDTIREAGETIVAPRLLGTPGYVASGVLLTFDDASRDHIDTVWPILERKRVRAVFFVPTCKVDQRGHLSRGDLVTLHQSGHVLGSHSHGNGRLDALSLGELREDLERSTELIASIGNGRPVFFAPPGGFCSDRIKRVAAENGYRFLRTMDWGYNRHLDFMNIQVLPMTGSLGGISLRMGLAQKAEFLMRTTFLMKNCLRGALSPRHYASLRGMLFHRGTN